ncbi:MAG TPA: hypothetical protein VNA04_09830, partial [Thermoanaerobaculia bacterium]|nr:hypothetical protein [Thermoanaerobaculia bacterium]
SFRLTAAGAYTGATHTLAPPVPPAFAQIRLARDGSRYLLAWWVPDPIQQHVFAYMTTVASDGTFAPPRAFGGWQGTLSGIAIAAAGDYRLVVHGIHQRRTSSSFDLFGTKVTPLLDGGTPEILAFSATLQSNVRVAASGVGHLVAWGENGPDRVARAYVRRFSNANAPLDEEPVELYAIEQEGSVLRLPAARVAATQSAYVAVWATPDGLFARRMAAGGSGFLDPAPLQVAPAATHFDVTTNGTDALVVWNGPCAQGLLCVMARRVAMLGNPDMTAAAIVHGGGFNHDVTVASDGRDFLVAWSEGQRECVITCSIGPFSLLAARVGADGRAIDPMPVSIEERRTFAEKPVIAFHGLQYLVLWSAWAEGWTVRGARVTREGAVLETDGAGSGTVIDPAIAPSSTQPVLVALGERFVLFHRVGVTTEGRPEVLWTAVTFPAGTPLSEVRSLPREIVMRHPAGNFGSLDAAVIRSVQLLLAYDRVAEGEYAGVPRVFFTRFGSVPPARRRAATH